MNSEEERPQGQERDTFADTIEAKAQRKLKAQREQQRSIWFGMGMFGMVGWSVAMPTLAGVIAGFWIDRHWPSRFSWTLMLLFIGAVLGCFNAWYWIRRESGPDRE